MATLGPLHTYVLPAVRLAGALPPLPAKAPRAIRTYQVDATLFLADGGTTIDHAVVLPSGGLLVGNIAWTATTVTFALGGGSADAPAPTVSIALTLANGDREDFALVQPIRATAPDIPADALSVGGQIATLQGGSVELTTVSMLPGGAAPGDALLAVRAGVPGLLPATGLAGGAQGGSGQEWTAGAPVSGHRALQFDVAGRVLHADPSSPALYSFAGISLQAAAMASPVLVAGPGDVVIEPTWSWVPGTALFVGAGGQLVTVPPSSGVLHQVAVAAAPTVILVQPYPPIVRN